MDQGKAYRLAILMQDRRDAREAVGRQAVHTALAVSRLGKSFRDLAKALEKLPPQSDTIEAGKYKIHLVEPGWVTSAGIVKDGVPVTIGDETWLSWNDCEAMEAEGWD